MAQPIKKKIEKIVTKPKKKPNGKRQHPKYGTSKLEEKFAKEFLDKLGVEYVYQFEAKDIGRFYDFKLGNYILLEIDGDYYHGYGKIHEDKNPMQKHNEWVDKTKDEWARAHGYLLYRIWEHDINENGPQVMKELKEILDIDNKKTDKNKRH